MNTRNLPEILLAVVQNPNNEILIVCRTEKETGTNGAILTWVFPGGEKRVDETNEQALKRIVMEETGYELSEVGKVISEREHPEFPVYVYYVGCGLKDVVQVIPPSDPEVKDPKWVKPEEIPNYFTTDYDPKVKETLKNIKTLS